MVYINDWDAFFHESEKLYLEHPAHTRYTLKYRHTDGKVVLKVTNDRVCLQFVTDQATDLKRIERLNNLFFTYMCGQDPHDSEADAADAGSRGDRPVSQEESGTSKKRRGKR
uniref:Signal recognition particle 9 kDa protein n=1 Tax=Strombidinopsis acuminata TaxID=141414 RepID=A0A7S3WIU2_9SPIT